MAACAPTRPVPATTTATGSDVVTYDNADYYESGKNRGPGISRLGRKRLLPDPHGGLGTTNDLTLRVTDIKLTSQYTILFLTFGEPSQARASYDARSSSDISFNADARLVAPTRADTLKTFRFIKAEGIVLSPDSQHVSDNEQVRFRLYFERLDPGIEDFSLFECEDTETTTCWNIRGMHIVNPLSGTATTQNQK